VLHIQRVFGRTGTEYANLVSVLKPPSGVPLRRELVNAPMVFTFAPFEPEVYRALPRLLQDKIAQSPEYRQAAKGGGSSPEELNARVQRMLGTEMLVKSAKEQETDLDDDIPF
jgi:hypothetical protein